MENIEAPPESLKLDPVGVKGRKFMEEGVWARLTYTGSTYLAKLPQPQLELACSGQSFQAWHILSFTGKEILYLPATMATLEPWNMNGRSLENVAILHPEYARKVDDEIRQRLSPIIQPPSLTVQHTPKDPNARKAEMHLV